MSVYTAIDSEQLEAFLADYAVGELEGFRGIAAGITNTNYFVDTTLGHWVLTIFERLTTTELPYFLDLMDHLAAQGVPSAHPVAQRKGGFLAELAGKPATLVYRLNGASVDKPTVEQCRNLGSVVAELHRAAESYKGKRKTDRGLAWARATRERLGGKLDAESLALLDEELAYQAEMQDTFKTLPRGIVHADLFRDNVLFDNDHVSGLIDFYFACNDALLFDLAVIYNDWCLTDALAGREAHWTAIAQAYHRRRPLTDAEHEAWPAVLRAAALRFWVSRLDDWHFPRDGDVTHQKDPAPFRETLLHHRKHPPTLLP